MYWHVFDPDWPLTLYFEVAQENERLVGRALEPMGMTMAGRVSITSRIDLFWG